MNPTLIQPSGAQVRAAQQEAAQAVRESQQAANDARELANAMRDQPPAPPAPPLPPIAIPGPPGAEAPLAGVPGAVTLRRGEDGKVTSVSVNGRTFVLDGSEGGPAEGSTAVASDDEGAVRILGSVLPIVGIVFGCITTWIMIESLSKFFTKRAERRNALEIAKLQTTAQSERFDRIEAAIEAMAVEVERVTEGQRFQTKLLTERAASLPQPALAPTTVAESAMAGGR
jgi:hypothetical protein